MKIVITGALGHIGSYLIRRLPQLIPHCHIVMIDNLSTQRYCSLFNLNADTHYQFIQEDITDKKCSLEFYLKESNVVIHLAAITDAANSFNQKQFVEHVNFTATKKVAQTCAKLNIPMIMASSTSVYGTQANTVDEDCDQSELKPQSPYAETKLKEEQFILETCQSNTLQAVIFRFGTIFGTSPGMRFHTAVNKFCWQAVMELPLTVWKTAYHQKRPYLHLDDAATTVAYFIQNQIFDNHIYNVVSTNATVCDIVAEIQSHIPTTTVNFVEHKIMNQLSYEVLNTRLTQLGIHLNGKLSIGIANTIDFLKNANQESYKNSRTQSI